VQPYILEQAFQQTSDIMILYEVTDEGFRYFKANPAAYGAGFRHESLGRTIYDMLPEPIAQRIDDMLKKAIAAGQAVRFDDVLTSSTGEVFGDIVATPIPNEAGAYTYVLGCGRDMTDLREKEAELDAANSFLESILGSTPDGIIVTDLELVTQKISKGFTALFGWGDEAIGKPLVELKLVSDEYRQEHMHLLGILQSGSTIPAYRTVRHRKNGSEVPVSVSYASVKDSKGHVTGYMAIYRNISDLVNTEAAAKEITNKYRLIAENTTDLVALLDERGVVLYASPSHEAVLGYPPSMYEGNLQDFWYVHPDDISQLRTTFGEVVERKRTATIVFRSLHMEGHYVWIEAKTTPIMDDTGALKQILTTARDVTERKKYEELLSRLAFYDNITQLANRNLLADRFVLEARRADRKQEQLALLFIDLDGFKHVNDTLGHAAGDILLREVAGRLVSSVRDIDLCARWAGDEFVVLLTDATFDETVRIAERISERIRAPIDLPEVVQVTSSIGIALYPDHGNTLDDLLKRADTAMYQAKMGGKNRYCFFSR